MSRHAAESLSISEHASWTSRSSNLAPARVRRLEEAITDIAAGIERGSALTAQDATKRGLEAIHELDDALRERQEWAHTGWGADDLGLWEGLVGARNASHHSSCVVVELQSGGEADSRLRWALDPDTIRGQSKRQEYEARLAGQPVLPALRSTLALLKATVNQS
jgi:hypothetical protein